MLKSLRPALPPLVLNKDGFPMLPAWTQEGGTRVIVWCRHCRSHHWHGIGFHGDLLIHRWAHCYVPRSPYDEKGYFLVIAGPADRDIAADLASEIHFYRWKRRHPSAEAYEVCFKPDGEPAVRHFGAEFGA